MANTTIQLKRSSVAGKQPNTSTLSIGELAINITDKKLYSSDGSAIFEPAANVTNINITGGLKANGSFGSNSQILYSNGSTVYWSNSSTIIDTQDNNPTSPSDGKFYWNSALGKLLVYYEDGDSGQWVEAVYATAPAAANGGGGGGGGDAAAAYSNAVSYADAKAANAYSNAIAYSGNAAAAYTNAVSYTDTKIGLVNTAITSNAATAYTNAVAYTDSRIIDSVTNTSISYAASANSVKNAYDRAIDANTRAASAQTAAASAYTNATSYADTKSNAAYSNAVSYIDGKIGTANAAITGNAATAYTNATSYTDTKIGTANAAITGNAATAYSNAVSYVDTKIGTANAAITGNAATAYTNAIAYAASNTYVNNTFAPLSGATFTGAVVVSNNLTVTGNLTLSGNTLIVGANNLVVSDAVISLHTPANLAPLTSNDGKNIGIAFHYYDTEDRHGLLYRDNSTGYLQYHTDGGDPITNSNPTGNSFGTIQAASFWAGNSSVYATVNATTFTGSANNASYLGGVAAASYVNTAGAYTRTGVTTFNANVVIGTTAGISANGSYGTANQVLTSNGTTVYWANVAAGTNTAAQYTWTNTQTFSNTITFGNTTVGTVINGSYLNISNSAAWYEANVTIGDADYDSNTSTYGNVLTKIIPSVIDLTGNTDSLGAQLRFKSYEGQPTKILIRSSGGTRNSPTDLSVGDEIGRIDFFPYNSMYGNFMEDGTAAILAQVGGSSPYLGTYADLVFKIGDGVSEFSEKLRISNTSITVANDVAISANGSVGSNGYVLRSNGSAVYWGNVTSYADDAYTNATSWADTKAADAYTNATSYADDVYLNATSWADTKAADAYTNAVSYVDGKSYVNTSQLSSNLANYVQNTDSRTLSGNLNFTGANTTIAGNLTISSTGELIITNGAGIYANGSLGTANQVLTSNGSSVYWANTYGGATVSVSDSAPASPQANSLWWKSDEGRLYIYYNDGTSSQWVSASPDGAGQYLPLTGGTVSGNVTIASGNVVVGNVTITNSNITINSASVATTGKAIAMAIVFGG